MGTFKKTVENFICENCGTKVKGDGYTNHCPKCLYSKHVDIAPGDREETCGGLMAPIRIDKEGENLFIVQKCEKCGFERRNKTSENDNLDLIIEIMSSPTQSL